MTKTIQTDLAISLDVIYQLERALLDTEKGKERNRIVWIIAREDQRVAKYREELLQ